MVLVSEHSSEHLDDYRPHPASQHEETTAPAGAWRRLRAGMVDVAIASKMVDPLGALAYRNYRPANGMRPYIGQSRS